MNKPFNDDPVEVLVKKFLTQNGTVLDLRLKYIGDEGLEYLAKCPDLVDLEVLKVHDRGIAAPGSGKATTYCYVWPKAEEDEQGDYLPLRYTG